MIIIKVLTQKLNPIKHFGSILVVLLIIVLTIIFKTKALSVIISLLPLLLLYLLVYLIIKKSKSINILKSITRKEIIYSVLILLITALFVYYYISKEKTIYFWDFGGYWKTSLSLMEPLSLDPLQTLKNVFATINTNEYNSVLALMYNVPLKLLGQSYVSFIVLTYCLFIIPSVIILSLSFRTIIAKYTYRIVGFHYLVLVGCIYPFFILPLFAGYADSAALLLISSIFLLNISTDVLKFDPVNNLLIGLSLLFLVVIRRYFAYWVVGYFFGLLAYYLVNLTFSKIKKQITKGFVLNMAMISVIFLAVLVILFRPFLERSLFSNYASAYSAYNLSSFYIKILDLLKYIGGGVLLVVLIGMLINVKNIKGSKENSLWWMIAIVVHTIVTAALFYRVQDMGIQHYYLVANQIFILFVCSWLVIYSQQILKNIARFIILLTTASLVFFNFLYSVSLLPSNINSLHILGNKQYQARIRQDLDQIEEMDAYLEQLGNNKSIYVLASSSIMTDDIVRGSYLPQLDIPLNLIPISHIDLRDGFSTSFFDADIVVVCDPIQYHLAYDSQRVVTTLAELMLDKNSNVRSHYTLLNSFQLDYNVTALIFSKDYPYSRDEIIKIRDLYNNYYPNYPELFYNRFNDYIASKE